MSTERKGMADEPRDPHIAKVYREAVASDPAKAEPPTHLDSSIRAAARRAVQVRLEPVDVSGAMTMGGAEPEKRGLFRRWQMPLAAAATVALAIGVAVKVYDSGEADLRGERSPVAQAPAPAESAPGTIDASKQKADQRPSAGSGAGVAAAPAAPAQEFAKAGADLATHAPAARPPVVGNEAREDKVAAAQAAEKPGEPAILESSRSREQTAPPAATSAPQGLQPRPERRAMMEDRMAAGSSVTSLVTQLSARPAEAWLEEIRALKRAGRIADANTLITEFRKRFPTVALPEDLR